MHTDAHTHTLTQTHLTLGDHNGDGGGLPSMEKDPLAWWGTNADTFKFLSRVARKYLSIPAASAAAERMFSYTGMRVGKVNAQLGDDSLLDMMLIRSLTAFVDRWGPQYLPEGD